MSKIRERLEEVVLLAAEDAPLVSREDLRWYFPEVLPGCTTPPHPLKTVIPAKSVWDVADEMENGEWIIASWCDVVLAVICTYRHPSLSDEQSYLYNVEVGLNVFRDLYPLLPFPSRIDPILILLSLCKPDYEDIRSSMKLVRQELDVIAQQTNSSSIPASESPPAEGDAVCPIPFAPSSQPFDRPIDDLRERALTVPRLLASTVRSRCAPPSTAPSAASKRTGPNRAAGPTPPPTRSAR